MKIAGYGEDRLVAELTRNLPQGRDVLIGSGDDCAVIGRKSDAEWLLLKTDCLVEGIHFLPEERRERVGWKALARALSDIAAMSGVPRHALVTIAIPPDRTVASVKALYAGLRKAAQQFGVSIVGGETARSNRGMFLSIALTGSVERSRCVTRSGGRSGDLLYVTGRLGGSLAGRHLNFQPRLSEARWLTEHFRIRAMMDLSDGLGADLPRLAKASGIGFLLDEDAIPRTKGCSIAEAISDGEDYELLFAIAPRDASLLERRWHAHFPKLPLTRIGRLGGKPKRARIRGYDHFA